MDPHLTNIVSSQSPSQPISSLPVDDQAAGIPNIFSLDYLIDLFPDPSVDFIYTDDQNPNPNPHSDQIVGENPNLIPSDHEDHASPNFANREDEIYPNPPPTPTYDGDFLEIQNVSDELPWAPPEDNREDEINPNPPTPLFDCDFVEIQNVSDELPWAPPEDNREDEINPSPPPTPTYDGDFLEIQNVSDELPWAPPEDNREDEINPSPPLTPTYDGDFLEIQNVSDELPWASPEDNREDEINPNPPTSDGDFIQITNLLSDGPWAPLDDNSTILVRRKKRTDGIVAAGRTSEDTGRRPINVSSTQRGPARTKGKSVAAKGRGSGRVGVKRPRDQPSEVDALEVIATKTPKMEVEVELSIDDKEQLEDYESLQKTLEFFRVKIKEAVGVLKPKITSVSGESSNEAFQQLELLARLAWQHNHIKILNNSEE